MAKAGYSLVPGYVSPYSQRVLTATERHSETRPNQRLRWTAESLG
jgi:hypothetical protein